MTPGSRPWLGAEALPAHLDALLVGGGQRGIHAVGVGGIGGLVTAELPRTQIGKVTEAALL